MSVEVRHDEEHEQYELGATIDGTFVPFAQVPVSHVEALAEQAKNAAANDKAAKASGKAS